MVDDHAPARTLTREELLARITAPTDPEALRAAVQEGLDDIAAGRFVEGDEVRRWIASLGTDAPLPRPRPR